jgi:hypothetical protein
MQAKRGRDAQETVVVAAAAPEARVGAQERARADVRVLVGVEVRAGRVEAKARATAVGRVGTKPEARVEAQAETNTRARVEQQAGTKMEARVEATATPEEIAAGRTELLVMEARAVAEWVGAAASLETRMRVPVAMASRMEARAEEVEGVAAWEVRARTLAVRASRSRRRVTMRRQKQTWESRRFRTSSSRSTSLTITEHSR